MEINIRDIKKSVEQIRKKNGFICDMDGVIYHGNKILPGVKEFIEWLQKEKKRFLFLTNSSERSQRELQDKLARMGILVDKEHFYTSALATASFVHSQKPRGSAFVIGEAGLLNALYDVGYRMNNVDPEYVIMGEARSYSYEKIEQAVNLVVRGAKLIGTNPDVNGPIENGIAPATAALIAPIEIATGKKAYFVGKPNPLMMRSAVKKLQCNAEETVIIGDRMDTDIIAGIESEIDTCLVLSGITAANEINQFAYSPKFILNGVEDIIKS